MNKRDFIEQMRTTQDPLMKMVEMVPEGQIGWAPAVGFMTLGQLLYHLGQNWCIVRMMVTDCWPDSNPEAMAEAMKLKNMPSCSKSEAIEAMRKDFADAAAYIENELSEEDFFSRTVSAPWGFKGEIWKAVLMARDHQMHHKMQLHIYLKLLKLPVNTQTLYGM
ncbi:MAG: DinB family protein [Acidobacteria bacterium]|nr:DinB family protein [Acidobacteriota bacterium]